MQKRTKKHWGGDEGDDYPQVEGDRVFGFSNPVVVRFIYFLDVLS
jgi:hypothetical protein